MVQEATVPISLNVEIHAFSDYFMIARRNMAYIEIDATWHTILVIERDSIDHSIVYTNLIIFLVPLMKFI